MEKVDIANEILEILRDKYKTEGFIKGSLGYGTVSKKSDIDIQMKVPNVTLLKEIAECFSGDLSEVFVTDNEGDSYTSYLIQLEYKGEEVSLLYDDHPEIFERVRQIINDIKQLPIEQRYILRLISEGYKYMSRDAHKVLLEIFDKISPVLKQDIVENIKRGELVDKKEAKVVKRAVQTIFINETNCKYPKKFLN